MNFVSKFLPLGEKLFPFIKNAVQSAETLFGTGNGTAKKAAVVGLVETGVSAFDLLEGAAVPPEEVGALVSPIIDEFVTLYNKLSLFGHKAPAPNTQTPNQSNTSILDAGTQAPPPAQS